MFDIFFPVEGSRFFFYMMPQHLFVNRFEGNQKQCQWYAVFILLYIYIYIDALDYIYEWAYIHIWQRQYQYTHPIPPMTFWRVSGALGPLPPLEAKMRPLWEWETLGIFELPWQDMDMFFFWIVHVWFWTVGDCWENPCIFPSTSRFCIGFCFTYELYQMVKC